MDYERAGIKIMNLLKEYLLSNGHYIRLDKIVRVSWGNDKIIVNDGNSITEILVSHDDINRFNLAAGLAKLQPIKKEREIKLNDFTLSCAEGMPSNHLTISSIVKNPEKHKKITHYMTHKKTEDVADTTTLDQLNSESEDEYAIVN